MSDTQLVLVSESMRSEIDQRSSDIAKAVIFGAIANVQDRLGTDSEQAAEYWSQPGSGWYDLWDIVTDYAAFELESIMERRLQDEARGSCKKVVRGNISTLLPGIRGNDDNTKS